MLGFRSLLLRGWRAVAVGPIRAYRRLVSPLLPSVCRFYPSCSAYAECVLSENEPVRGVYLAVGRIFRCNPWNPGGLDLPPTADHRLIERNHGSKDTAGCHPRHDCVGGVSAALPPA